MLLINALLMIGFGAVCGYLSAMESAVSDLGMVDPFGRSSHIYDIGKKMETSFLLIVGLLVNTLTLYVFAKIDGFTTFVSIAVAAICVVLSFSVSSFTTTKTNHNDINACNRVRHAFESGKKMTADEAESEWKYAERACERLFHEYSQAKTIAVVAAVIPFVMIVASK
ncbi:MAG: hypothetical protein IKK29_05915 [Christensenellaceae bacterium]|nr:hypothetical protein [Christensenellaceae bacterium]